ncbi:MAG TPA: hypothetical protein VN698_10375, partial [Bacteroidia bacterium]|nr:hypothetical protein [Bacteroidia bacterium]
MSLKTSLQSANPMRNYYILIAALSFLLYANTLQHGFVLDDIAVIQNNSFVQQGISGIPKILTTFYWQGYWNSNAGLYRPTSLIAFAIEHQLSNKPFIHHFFNVVYYSLLCCLLFQFLCTVFNKINPRFFLLAVLLFIVHPIHTEVVANIKSRDEIFALLFFLLACQQLYASPTKTTKSILLSSLFFLLALLSKEGVIALLPIIFLIDYQREKQILPLLKHRYMLLITAALWLAWHQYIIASSTAPRLVYTYNDNSLFSTSSLLQQKATALGMFATYIVKAFYPYTLSYDYSFNQIPIINLFSFPAIAGLLIFAALIYVAYKNTNTHWLITFSIALLILPLLLTANIFFNIGATMADRFLFTSTIGSCIIICWLVFKIFKINLTDKTNPSTAQYTILAVLLLFSIQTLTRNRVWQSNYTLFKHDVKNSPNSARVHYNNALALEQTTDISNQP